MNKKIIQSVRDILSVDPNTELSPIQAAQGWQTCFKNSKDLLEEAILLRSNGKLARACVLAVIGLEEIGKMVLLTNAIFFPVFEGGSWSWPHFWKDFYRHSAKQRISGGLGILGKLYKKQSLLQIGMEPMPDGLQPVIEVLKQTGLYSCYKNNYFHSPEPFENSEWTDYVIKSLSDRVDFHVRAHSTQTANYAFLLHTLRFWVQLISVLQNAETENDRRKLIKQFLRNQKNAVLSNDYDEAIREIWHLSEEDIHLLIDAESSLSDERHGVDSSEA
jgi:AbiV family abortive infection protein